jgi:hypothetical protein
MSRPPRVPSLDSPDEIEVLAEVRRNRGGNYVTGCLLVAVFLIFPAVLYFGFFAVFVLEEMFVGPGWFRENLPESAGRFLQAIYTPLFRLIDQFDG